jgi:hypothetical protein
MRRLAVPRVPFGIVARAYKTQSSYLLGWLILRRMTTEVARHSPRRSRLLSRTAKVARRWKWVFLPVAFVYIAIVAAYFAHIVASVAANADSSSVQVVTELYAHRAGGTVYLSTLPWYSTLFFGLATEWLPAHRLIWDDTPFLIGLLAIGLMAWTTSRLAGRWAATVTAVLMVCASPLMFEQMFWLDNHMTSYYSLALLAAYMVLLEERVDSLSTVFLVTSILVIGVIVGVNLASDDLLLISGPVPLLLAAAIAWYLRPTARAARAMGVLVLLMAVVAVSAICTLLIVHSAGIIPRTVPIDFVTSEQVVTNFTWWWESIALLGNGSFFGEAITATTALAAICAAMSICLLFLIPRFTWRHLRERLARRTAEVASGQQSDEAALSAYLVDH